jgi:hypothetical protein
VAVEETLPAVFGNRLPIQIATRGDYLYRVDWFRVTEPPLMNERCCGLGLRYRLLECPAHGLVD